MAQQAQQAAKLKAAAGWQGCFKASARNWLGRKVALEQSGDPLQASESRLGSMAHRWRATAVAAALYLSLQQASAQLPAFGVEYAGQVCKAVAISLRTLTTVSWGPA